MKAEFILKIFLLLYLVFQPYHIAGQKESSDNNKGLLTKVQISETEKVKVFDNLWETVNRSYFDSTFNGHNWAKLREIYLPQVTAAKDKIELKDVLNKMLGELKTSHLRVSFEVKVSGKTLKKYFGDNVNYKQNDILLGYGYSTANFGNLKVITNVDENSNAAESGLKVGWIVKSCENYPLTKKIDDSLVFTETANCVFLDEKEQEKAITLRQVWFLKPRSTIQRVSKLLDDVLYLKFNSFDKGTGKWIKNQVIDNNLSVKAVIIDLRNNYGGLVNELKDSLSPFFPAQTLAGSFIERDMDEKNFRLGSDNFYKGKVIVLINGESYSAAEIFAAAFQESERGQIIGQKSAGEVLNSETKSLSNGLKLLVPILDYKTVKGLRLEGNGVKPDVEIPFSVKDFGNPQDVALEKALEILRNQ